MPVGTAAGVSVLPAARVPVPPVPGVVVVECTTPKRVLARALAAAGASAPMSVEEAAAELDRRRAAACAEPAARVAACAAGVEAARASARKGRPPGLDTVPAGLTAAGVRAAARRTREAAESLEVARDAVGERPTYDDGAARAVREAQADIEQARQDRASALPRANWVLTRANALGAVLVAGRFVSEAFDRTMVFVGAVPLAALVYSAFVVLVPIRRGRAAGRRRWAALRSMNVSTLAGLAALQERTGAWERRAARVKAADAEYRAAGAAFRTMVGGGVALASADRLAKDLDKAESLDDAVREAEEAWAAAAADLQAAEDAGAGGDPLVVLDPDPDADPEERRRAVERLAALAGPTSLVVVAAVHRAEREQAPAVEPEPEPEPAVPEPAPAATTPPAVIPAARCPNATPTRLPGEPRSRPAATSPSIVDLRDRVRIGLQRLRARSLATRDRPKAG